MYRLEKQQINSFHNQLFQCNIHIFILNSDIYIYENEGNFYYDLVFHNEFEEKYSKCLIFTWYIYKISAKY